MIASLAVDGSSPRPASRSVTNGREDATRMGEDSAQTLSRSSAGPRRSMASSDSARRPKIASSVEKPARSSTHQPTMAASRSRDSSPSTSPRMSTTAGPSRIPKMSSKPPWPAAIWPTLIPPSSPSSTLPMVCSSRPPPRYPSAPRERMAPREAAVPSPTPLPVVPPPLWWASPSSASASRRPATRIPRTTTIARIWTELTR
mmetsp:Transcript_12318/g.29037  ORF Transcript_12318/g.29037 Transcript_12318/m.29037 type:complete len:202 (-) Transcript_12318:641-1246(-)